MKALVTGAAGFIGGHLVDSLVADGHDVRCFVKRGKDSSRFEDMPVEVVFGDLRDLQTVRWAVEGMEVVYHLGALSRVNLETPDEEYRAVNTGGTRNVLEACRLSGVGKVVYTSSIEASGPSPDGRPLTEKSEPRPTTIYGETKLGGELAVREYVEKYGLHAVTVRPPMTYGPRSLLYFPRLFGFIRRGFYPIVGTGRALIEFHYVKNQVHGLKLAAERGKAGEVYFISDERSYTTEEIVREIALQLGVDLRVFHIPLSVAWPLAHTFEFLNKFLKFYPFYIKDTARPIFHTNIVRWASRSRMFCDCSKARQELGYIPPYTLADGIRETIAWHHTIGRL